MIALWLACGEPAATTDGPPAEEIVAADLGTHDVSDTGWYSEPMVVSVPEGTTSTMVTCGDFGPSAVGAIYDLTTPSGTLAYQGDDPGAYGGFRSDFLDDRAVGLLPVSPRLASEAGDWTLRWFVGAGAGGSVSCEARHRVDTVSERPTLLVDLVFVGVDGLDATTAQTDANFQTALDTFLGDWSAAGVDVAVSYVDFEGDSAAFTVIEVSDDDASELGALFETASPFNDRVVTFFFVTDIANTTAGGATILGIAAGPPGAASLSRTSKSGVAIATLDLATAPTDVGRVMAHEGGHFLGLFHTTEKDGSQTDPLDDTPECGVANDADANGVLSSAECAAHGSDNAMWWTLGSDSPAFSDDQVWVVARNPAVD